MSITIQGLYQSITLDLITLYPEEEAKAIADRLVDYFFDLKPMQRALNGKNLVEQERLVRVKVAMERLLKHEPLQYVIGKAYFLDMEFEVNPSVLIPRPETEELVILVLEDLDRHRQGMSKKLRILDIGTGSGCIAISLKKKLPMAEVTALDVSEGALEVARRNAVSNQVELNFLLMDILDRSQWPSLPEFDLIVSNPPYVTLAEKEAMLPNVLDHEPHNALFVPDEDPLIFYKAIASFAKDKIC